MKKTCILVLGMHRSGTSALTGTLGLLGINLGSNLMGADEDNEKGYFENHSFYHANEDLLSQINSSWEDIFFNEDKLNRIENTDALKKVLIKEFKGKNIFAIKDPRLVFLFPVYAKVLKELNIDIKIIIPYRNPVEVAASLTKRNDFSPEKGMLLWAYHILLAEKFSRDYQRVFIDFNDLIFDTKNTIQQMTESLDIDFNSTYTEKKKYINEFLDPGIKHHNVSIDEILNQAPQIVKEIFSQRKDFNKSEITNTFNQLRDKLFSDQKLFYNKDITDTFNELDNLKQAFNQLKTDTEPLKRLIETKDQWLQEKAQWIKKQDQWIEKQDQQIQEQDQQIQEKDQQIQDNDQYIQEKDQYIQDKDQYIRDNDQYIQEQDQQIQDNDQYIQEKDQQIQDNDQYIQHLHELVQSLRLKNRVKNMIPKKAREVLHISQHSVKNPVKLFKMMDKQYANKLIKHIKQGNFSYILERMSHYVNQQPSTIHLDLMPDYGPEEILTFPITIAPKVSIIIPVYNQFDYTHKCLRSILEFTNNIDYEIIIADDVSSDATQNIHKYIKNIKVVRNEKNLGFLLNCNNAAKEAQGDYLFFLNNDTTVQKNWLSTLLETIENDASIGMVGSKLVYPDGRQQEAGGIIWDDASGWNYGRLDDPEKSEYSYLKEVDYISGAAIMIRTGLWKEIGGFDERYVPAYYEDTDLAFEVRKHGYKVILQPKSVVVHFEGISNGTDTSSGLKKYQVVNQEKFYDKWKATLQKAHFPHAQDVFLARDRSKNKKTLLFIDHYVPHYDQDAGSRATLNYLELFVKHGINVKFLGDNFYHYPNTPYVSTLEQMGIEVLYGSDYAQNWEIWLKENGAYFDYIVLSRPHISKKYIDIVKKYTKAKIIYFAVDLHYLREEREYQISQDKGTLKSSKEWKKLEFDIMRKSDITCFYSHVEVDLIKKEDPTINTLQIPLFIYNEFSPIAYTHNERKNIMFVGGFTHTPNIDAVTWFVEDIMPKIRNMNISFKVYIIGSNPPEKIQDYDKQYDDIIVKGRVSDEELETFYRTCRLVIAPLRYGAGMKGKVVEALYNSIPLITTPIGAEGLENIDKTIKIAENSSEFAKEVIEVYTDEKSGMILSQKSREYCKKYFSVEHAEERIFKQGIELLK